jgi:hypothetical protein
MQGRVRVLVFVFLLFSSSGFWGVVFLALVFLFGGLFLTAVI